MMENFLHIIAFAILLLWTQFALFFVTANLKFSHKYNWTKKIIFPLKYYWESRKLFSINLIKTWW